MPIREGVILTETGNVTEGLLEERDATTLDTGVWEEPHQWKISQGYRTGRWRHRSSNQDQTEPSLALEGTAGLKAKLEGLGGAPVVICRIKDDL
jgi:hypothetical protein